MLRKIYLSKLGYVVSIILHVIALGHKPFMVYGFYNKKQKCFKKHTRISSSAKLINKKKLDIGNHVWIGHYSVIDCIGGVTIGEGVNISSHCVIYSHSSHDAIRLLGKKFITIPAEKRDGYVLKPVSIGSFTFIGTSSIILPGARIGTGCIIGAGSLINKEIPDFAIAIGNPAKIVGDTRKRDKENFADLINHDCYYTHYNS